MHWISANMGTILSFLVLLAVVFFIVRSLIRQKKQGKSSCGCNCANCSMHEACHCKK